MLYYNMHSTAEPWNMKEIVSLWEVLGAIGLETLVISPYTYIHPSIHEVIALILLGKSYSHLVDCHVIENFVILKIH